MMTSCVCAARYFRACSSSFNRVASSWAGSSSSPSSPDSTSSSATSPMDTSPASSSPSPSFSTRTSPVVPSPPVPPPPPSGSFGMLPISPPWMGSSSERFPSAFSGSTGEAPCDCWPNGTVSFIRFVSEEEEGDPARFGESMSRSQSA
ncbi:hypothetical protein OG21DRAFT_777211 [Imleria badia]|nr:hypothetical protein OG21DRAFT_777211 [Imleria badia]